MISYFVHWQKGNFLLQYRQIGFEVMDIEGTEG